MIRKFSEKELEQFVRHLSKLYKKSALRIKLDPDHLLKHDRDFVYTINVCLEECSKDTKFIIKNEFLEKKDNSWYLDFYSKSTFYRLKKKAIIEFIDCMDI